MAQRCTRRRDHSLQTATEDRVSSVSDHGLEKPWCSNPAIAYLIHRGLALGTVSGLGNAHGYPEECRQNRGTAR